MECTVHLHDARVELHPCHPQTLATCCGIELPLPLSHAVASVHVTLQNQAQTRVGALQQTHDQPLTWLMPRCSFTTQEEVACRWADVTVVKFQLSLKPRVALEHLQALQAHVRPLGHAEGQHTWRRVEAARAAGSSMLHSLFVHPAHLAALMLPRAPARNIVGVVATVALPPFPAGTGRHTLSLHLPPLQRNHILAEAWVHVHNLTHARVTIEAANQPHGTARPRTTFLTKNDALLGELPPIFLPQWWFRADMALVPSSRLALCMEPMSALHPVAVAPATTHASVVAFYLEVPEPLAEMDPALHDTDPAVLTSTSVSQRVRDESGFHITRWHMAPHGTIRGSWAPPTVSEAPPCAGDEQGKLTK